MEKITIGDAVKLTGGQSPIMTVNIEYDHNKFGCVWFSKSESGFILKEGTFHQAALKKVQAAE